MGLRDWPPVRRTRRNHAIEHATIHVLSRRHPTKSFAGRSDSGGFYILGDTEADDVRSAVAEAIERLRDEPRLAIHPFCGTNLVVGGILAGLASTVALMTMPRDERGTRASIALPRMLLAGTLAAVVSQPLGPVVQRRVTVLPDSEGVRVRSIETSGRGLGKRHRVSLEDVPSDRA
ncbi:MAG: DUF6391 domain-containing protein [Anaerolineae bacterium]|jgi:hypothetical protein